MLASGLAFVVQASRMIRRRQDYGRTGDTGTRGGVKAAQAVANWGDCRVLTLPVATGHQVGNAGVAGLEPVTSAVTGQRSNQLSYTPTKGRRKLVKLSSFVNVHF